MRSLKKLGCKCDECPLKPWRRDAVLPEPATEQKLIVVNDKPTRAETKLQRPMMGRGGVELFKILKKQGIKRENCHITTSVLCHARRRLSLKEQQKAIDCCRPRLEKEFAGWKGPVLLLGNDPLQSITHKNKVVPWRGYPVEARDEFGKIEVMPTLSPKFLMAKPMYAPIWETDIKRMLAKSWKSWRWPTIEIHTGPAMRDELARILQEAEWVGVDVEVAGDSWDADLLCIGIADETGVVSVPYPFEDEEIEAYVREILADDKIGKVYQNRSFDLLSLEHYGFAHAGQLFDTLDAHAVVAPQLAHDLGFIASNFFAAPRWKTEFRVFDDRKGSDAFARATAAELRDYNAKDAYMTVMLRRPLQEEIDKQGVQDLYDETMLMGNVGIKMTKTGIYAAPETVRDMNDELTTEVADLEKQFRKFVGDPDFNLNSPKQLKKLFFEKYDITPRFHSAQTGEASLNKNALESIIAEGGPAGKAAQILYAHRQADKLLSAYVKPLVEKGVLDVLKVEED